MRLPHTERALLLLGPAASPWGPWVQPLYLVKPSDAWHTLPIAARPHGVRSSGNQMHPDTQPTARHPAQGALATLHRSAPSERPLGVCRVL